MLAFATILLQLSVFLQPLLPKHYQIESVCQKVTHELRVLTAHQDVEPNAIHQNEITKQSDHEHQALNHQCQYCVLYGNLVVTPEIGIKEVQVRIKVRMMAFAKNAQNINFALQRLYLLPQGRAPPFQ